MLEILILGLAGGFAAQWLHQRYFSAQAAERRVKKAIRKLPRIEQGAAWFAHKYPHIPYGRGSYGVPEVHDFKEDAKLSIGAYCSIADRVHILLGGHHRTEWVTTYPVPYYMPEAGPLDRYDFSRGDVVIGNDVWLCSNCTILSGITVGHGAVVAANAHVVRDVPPYAVVGGNPAKILSWRFPQEQREALLEIAWWDWPHADIVAAGAHLCSTDIQGFIAYARQRPQLSSAPGKAEESFTVGGHATR
ncbi:MAG: CatB-related O-acetyltransferase [Pseudomonas sp.]|uniref:CatB-related O-acetyltransferase n=1 Tax=Pseudomonas abieticivorans TaxID=2931382 RepID=UPI0020C0172A|nr:CatB-related O-acetyltransferase [Pseudomonas sp. PIA16]MDE1169565.1 CatB-related O-acetyltransferase [Pseudomonas sp.]